MTYKDVYFTRLHDEKILFCSGANLPDPAKGPYKFVDCVFHPRIWAALNQMYRTSEYVNSYKGVANV